MTSLATQPLRGTFFRYIDLRYLVAMTPLSAIGSKLYGGRYNSINGFEAFYVADTGVTAMAETGAIINSGGVISGVKMPPRVMLSLDVDLQSVLNLTDSKVQSVLTVSLADLLKKDWKVDQANGTPIVTQRVGAAARAVEIEALIVPSARQPGAKNLVVIVDRLRSGSRVELYDDGSAGIPKYAIDGTYPSSRMPA